MTNPEEIHMSKYNDADFRAGYYHAHLAPAVRDLAHDIATCYIEGLPTGRTLDDAAGTTVHQHDPGLTADQVAAAIIHARELVSQHGVCAWLDGTKWVVRAGDDETRAHDTRVAASLVNHEHERPRTFALIRDEDVTGASGTGHVADGAQFADGTVVIRWIHQYASTVVWASVDDAIAVHGHDGLTRIQWDDEI
jgi:hypothetical protein